MRWPWSRPAPPSGRQVDAAADVDPVEVLIWSRQGCHLCEELEQQVRATAGSTGRSVVVAVEDVDELSRSSRPEDQELAARLHTLVPVLVVDGVEIGHWRLTDEEVRAALTRRAT
ncbi:glutaredoxin family protein [Ornithinimicrobium panacihumi]|uniref:glutaredoxin family protein n=1 Tax=Ornithinimicrobium panacihumi TaxID=2008449 RepID=UPI003F88B176